MKEIRFYGRVPIKRVEIRIRHRRCLFRLVFKTRRSTPRLGTEGGASAEETHSSPDLRAAEERGESKSDSTEDSRPAEEAGASEFKSDGVRECKEDEELIGGEPLSSILLRDLTGSPIEPPSEGDDDFFDEGRGVEFLTGSRAFEGIVRDFTEPRPGVLERSSACRIPPRSSLP